MTPERLAQLKEAAAASRVHEQTGETISRVRALDVFDLIAEVELLRRDQQNWFAYLRWKAGQDAEWRAMLARSAR